MALPFNKDITIFSNGPVPTDSVTQLALKKVLATGVKLEQRRVTRLVNNGPGPENGITVEFAEGESRRLGMLLHRPDTRPRAADLIRQLGLETKANGDVVVDPMMSESSLKGCIVAGDAMESIKQAAVAVGTGEFAFSSFFFSVSSFGCCPSGEFDNLTGLQVSALLLSWRTNSARKRASALSLQLKPPKLLNTNPKTRARLKLSRDSLMVKRATTKSKVRLGSRSVLVFEALFMRVADGRMDRPEPSAKE